MKKIFLIVILLTLFSGCPCRRTKIEPPYPQNASGWKYREENGLGVVGEFVLKVGESTNNSKFQVKLVELHPSSPCVDQGNDYMRLQFTRTSDNQVICEQTIPEHAGGNLCERALEEFSITGFRTININLKDQWAHFMLFGYKTKIK